MKRKLNGLYMSLMWGSSSTLTWFSGYVSGAIPVLTMIFFYPFMFLAYMVIGLGGWPSEL